MEAATDKVELLTTEDGTKLSSQKVSEKRPLKFASKRAKFIEKDVFLLNAFFILTD